MGQEVRLGARAAAEGFRLRSLDTTPSTNDEARLSAEAGDPGRLWVVGAVQTAGRGRHGRSWTSPAGNLHASLLLVAPCEPRIAPQLGFVAGLALYDAVDQLTGIGAERLALKWPNDLLLDGAKVAGLLLEGLQLPGGGFGVVTGIGVNVAAAPDDTPYPATALARLAPDLDRSRLFAVMSDAFSARLAAWDRPGGFGPIRDAWLARAYGLGGNVTIRLPGGEKQGVFRGLDVDGRLELAHKDGIERIDAGDLFFGSR